MNPRTLKFKVHAYERMRERGFSSGDVRRVLADGEVIASYPEDKPYPSKLIFARVGKRPVHVVVAENADEDEAIVVTVYEPDAEEWDKSFRTRRRNR